MPCGGKTAMVGSSPTWSAAPNKAAASSTEPGNTFLAVLLELSSLTDATGADSSTIFDDIGSSGEFVSEGIYRCLSWSIICRRSVVFQWNGYDL
jgi:hypothetical protein